MTFDSSASDPAGSSEQHRQLQQRSLLQLRCHRQLLTESSCSAGLSMFPCYGRGHPGSTGGTVGGGAVRARVQSRKS